MLERLKRLARLQRGSKELSPSEHLSSRSHRWLYTVEAILSDPHQSSILVPEVNSYTVSYQFPYQDSQSFLFNFCLFPLTQLVPANDVIWVAHESISCPYIGNSDASLVANHI